MDYLQSIRTFVRIAELGNYSRAAKSMNISNSLATRQIASLEHHLNARLFQRSTRRLSLTEQGRAYLECVREVLRDIERAEQLVATNSHPPAGTLRIVAPVTFGLHGFSSMLNAYAQRYPEVTLDVTLTDRQVSLIDERFDVGLLTGRQTTGDRIVRRRLITHHMTVCASPGYLRRYGLPVHPAELSTHAWLHLPCERHVDQLEFSGPHGPVRVSFNNAARTNNADMLRQFALLEMGIAILPRYLVNDDLARGTLASLLDDYRLPCVGIDLVYPSQYFPPKVRAFVEHLSEFVRNDVHDSSKRSDQSTAEPVA
ncbi:LysR family transcriptional regulator [Burkholderia sp. TSV86]|uniref:LysR family transcriptional regulator n=1 Tax=Burkholderia sp. TSV86 TaxID=1385594 RepID=UPI0009E74976|nr:LysR family transcriptional regulator [Burkholderia sp. TSV86]